MIVRIVIDDLVCGDGAAAGHSVTLGILKLCGPRWRGTRHVSWYRLTMSHLSLRTIGRAIGRPVLRPVRAGSWWSV